MIVGIVGLGLIGGSMAKAYSEAGHRVLAEDLDKTMEGFAMLSGAVSASGEGRWQECELILLAIRPQAAAAWLRTHGSEISQNAMVIDLCGTKQQICNACFPLAKQYGFTFVGGHPMAGTHNSGFKYARANLFKGAPMVLVPPEHYDMELLDRVKTLLAPAGFGKLSVTTAREHDETIAFTSQMCHVVSNAYIKSPTARAHRGFSAGSYKDLTRVAWLNVPMWTELIMENKEPMLHELDILIRNLSDYRQAIEHDDSDGLCRLLEEGKRIKEEVDGR